MSSHSDWLAAAGSNPKGCIGSPRPKIMPFKQLALRVARTDESFADRASNRKQVFQACPLNFTGNPTWKSRMQRQLNLPAATRTEKPEQQLATFFRKQSALYFG